MCVCVLSVKTIKKSFAVTDLLFVIMKGDDLIGYLENIKVGSVIVCWVDSIFQTVCGSIGGGHPGGAPGGKALLLLLLLLDTLTRTE